MPFIVSCGVFEMIQYRKMKCVRHLVMKKNKTVVGFEPSVIGVNNSYRNHYTMVRVNSILIFHFSRSKLILLDQ